MYKLDEQIGPSYEMYALYGSGVQTYETRIRGRRIRPMKRTEVHITRLDPIYPGLRLIDVVHPPGYRFRRPSYEERIGLLGVSGKRRFVKRKPI